MTIIPALAAGMMPFAALAQTEQQIPAVEVKPVGKTRSDPNGGQWFVETLDFGETKEIRALLYNPAEVAQTVRLYLADIRFDAQGVPEVQNVQSDVGKWGRFLRPTVSIAPKQQLTETFLVTAPDKNDPRADPGDHIGAVVAEQAPQGSGNIRSVKRIAVRFYATLPGEATREFVINKVTTKKDSAFYAREMTVSIQLKNTGRVRLEPEVKVDGEEAKGPRDLLSQASESYLVTRPVKFWGGPMRLQVDASTKLLDGSAGPVQQVRVTTWIIPWHLFVLLGFLGGLVITLRLALQKREGKYAAIQSDLRRLERLVAQQYREGPRPQIVAQRNDAQAAIRAAIKQARRAGDLRTADRLERKLADSVRPLRAARPRDPGPGEQRYRDTGSGPSH